jgi:hypothetical protein
VRADLLVASKWRLPLAIWALGLVSLLIGLALCRLLLSGCSGGVRLCYSCRHS